jgi:hypothetical protein
MKRLVLLALLIAAAAAARVWRDGEHYQGPVQYPAGATGPHELMTLWKE